ncbi:hypothetical protein [Sphingomonas sp. Root50]|uniref:hypothetical protein n=1 Tax=Sphingomonas sp. Root50 TaxID=1736551 RepID=UPI000A75032B|nr:hypothetical protein [Sphingomonas sp. Root50]
MPKISVERPSLPKALSFDFAAAEAAAMPVPHDSGKAADYWRVSLNELNVNQNFRGSIFELLFADEDRTLCSRAFDQDMTGR